MKKNLVLFLVAASAQLTLAQTTPERIDTAAIARIKSEGMNHSQVLDVLSYLTDVYGPRLTGSPGHMRAAEWVKGKLASWGLQNTHLEGWGPWGKGWELKRYYANVIGQQVWPLLSYPYAWSPGLEDKTLGDVVFLDATTDSALQTFKGKLKGKFVLINPLREVHPRDYPQVEVETDSSLLRLADDRALSEMPVRFQRRPFSKTLATFIYNRWKFLESENVAAVLTSTINDGGVMQFLQSASVPNVPESPRVSSYANNAPKILPQIGVNVEHYQRLVRMLQKGERPKIEMNLEVEFNRADSSYNVIGEIPGADLKDEVVMIGAHLDSWHTATGATDNATGVTVCMEAMRILKSLNLQPRRTIRVALWSGEEQGDFGSAAYVRKHFGEKEGSSRGSGAVHLTPEGEKFSAYFNDDNGTGKIRGVYMESNESLRPIFRAWLEPFKEMGASTLTLEGTTNTDHEAFVNLGLPGFQFIQDQFEYTTRTWHSNIDLYERGQEANLKQASIIMAAFAYNAAMRNEKLPRK